MEPINNETIISLGPWSETSLDDLLRRAWLIDIPGERIAFLSQRFLEIPYETSTLFGNATTPEAFVVNLGALDCFTLLDYIESMRLSPTATAFFDNLRMVRYKGGIVDFFMRNHFFTDWAIYRKDFVIDATVSIGGGKSIGVNKLLNMKNDGSLFLPGIEPNERDLSYIPSGAIDDSILALLQTGDYIGIYTPDFGLDVSHVGLIIRVDNSRLILRHASSAASVQKVVDVDLSSYLSSKPGIIVLRPL